MSSLDDDDKDMYEGPQYACERACFGRVFWRYIVPLAAVIALISVFLDKG